MTENDQRLYELSTWVWDQVRRLQPDLSELVSGALLEPVSGDASFRRYFRCVVGGQSWVCVDAPPDKEDSSAFVRVAELLARHDILVPRVLAFDLKAGFMLLSDFGNALMLDALSAESAETDYDCALSVLLEMQQLPVGELQFLPVYNADSLQREMDLFEAWFLPEYLQVALEPEAMHVLKGVYRLLLDSALEQPQVFVHRDYHSRNLMWVESGVMGAIDFQDAVRGPITYDLVSVLRDCYVKWPDYQVEKWLLDYAERLKSVGLLEPGVSQAQWCRWFDWMGLQRHIKVCGVFSRLCFRDGKASYLKDIPLTVRYLLDVSGRYSQMQPFGELLRASVLPALYRLNPQAQEIIET